MAGALQPVEQHDLHQAADVQARRGAVEADVGGDDPLAQRSVERGLVGDLVDEAARSERVEEFGLWHGALSSHRTDASATPVS